jgi:aminopeptidase N
MLRHLLGDDLFFRTIKHYLIKHQTGSVETRDLARATEEATGRQLDWFFDQWISKGAGHPELEVAYEWDAEKRLVALSVKQTQKIEGSTPLFRLPVTLKVVVGSRAREVEIDVSGAQHTFYVPCEREPSQAIFDPGKLLLARVKTEKPVPMWMSELAGAELAIDRVHAARQLAQKGGARAVQALIDALGRDASWIVRAAAADALGKLRGEAARDALIGAVATTAHPRARRAVVRALGNFKGDEMVAATLARVVEHGDPSYFVEAEACLSLGKTRAEQAPELLRLAAERESFSDVIRQHAYRGLAEARDESAIPLLMEATTYGRVSHGRRAAMAAVAELARGRRDRAERDARERAEELLRDRDFRVQFAALEALGTLGDPASIGPLREVVDRELDGRLRRRARELMRDLGEGRTATAEVSTLRDEVDRMRGELAVLRERVDRFGAANGAAAAAPAPKVKNGASKRARPTATATTTARRKPSKSPPRTRRR